MLTKRLNPFLNEVINPHQVAYLPNRQVHDNLRAFDIIKRFCNDNNVGYIASLDARKAFDSVDHLFIEAVLHKFGINKAFIDIFRTLYNEIESRVLINGFTTEAFCRVGSSNDILTRHGIIAATSTARGRAQIIPVM